MSRIQYISTSTIGPKSHNEQLSSQKIDLTPFDLRLIQLDYIQAGLLFSKPPSSAATATNTEQSTAVLSFVHHLKHSLSRTLSIFYPLAGRLALTENADNNTTTTCVSIDCNGKGAQFVHAAADAVKIGDIIDSVYVPEDIVCDLFCFNEAQNFQGVSKPLLAVQVTELVDGIFIGCSMNHAVGDGASFWHFFNTWSEISRFESGQISQISPVFYRQWFCNGGIDLPIHLPFSYNKIKGENINESSSDSSKRVVFNFSKEKIAELKSKANAEMGTNNISSLQSLMAHIWRAVTRGRHLSPDQKLSFRVPVALRQALKPALPEKYFGNAILGVAVKCTARELLQNGLGWAAAEINKTIATMTAEKASNYLESWVKNPKIVPNLWDHGSVAMLLVGSSPRFDVFGNDFGWGRPVAVRSGPVERKNGLLTVFAAVEEGGIDVETCLLPETLQAMADDAEFMEAMEDW